MEGRVTSAECLLSTRQVAERLGVSQRTIRYWAETGIIPAIKLGPKLWRFRQSDIEKKLGARA